MTTIDTSRASGTGRVPAVLFGLVSAVMAWNDRRVTRKCLLRLTDRELDDIGLVRSDIDNF